MVFSSIIFLFYFFPVTFLLYYVSPKKLRNTVCLIASLFFYAWGEPYYIILMLLSTAVNYFFGLSMGYGRKEKSRKLMIILGCVFNIGLLVVFKYASFLLETVSSVFNFRLSAPYIALPLGISFYTFQSLSYLIDVYRKEVPVQKRFDSLALYITMFPQLVAGPIVRYECIYPKLSERRLELNEIANGVFRFSVGLSKKVLFANKLGAVADGVWRLADISTVSAWIGMAAYSLQIYFDFSGYSDMAIGMGRMLGFDFPENFNYPYLSCSVSEFWRRWHMTLGGWFRDYVYFPLGGSRGPLLKTLRNLMLVWMLTGLWHGASMTFVVWGCYYGIIICAEKLAGIGKQRQGGPLQHILCLFLVMSGWVIFRSFSINEAFSFLKCLFIAGSAGFLDGNALLYLHDGLPLLILAAIGCTPVPKMLCRKLFYRMPEVLADVFRSLSVIALLCLCTLELVNSTYNPFIYFRF